jgi:hypothetical protein
MSEAVTISQLPLTTTLADDAVSLIVQDGKTYRSPVIQLGPVRSFGGRTGDVVLQESDLSSIGLALLDGSNFTGAVSVNTSNTSSAFYLQQGSTGYWQQNAYVSGNDNAYLNLYYDSDVNEWVWRTTGTLSSNIRLKPSGGQVFLSTQLNITHSGDDEGFVLTYSGVGDSAMNVVGGHLHMSGGKGCLTTEGSVMVVGLNTMEDPNYEDLHIKWDSTSSSYHIITEGVGTGSIRPITIGATKTIVKQISGSSNIQEWQNSSGTALACLSSTGRLGIGTATPGSANANNLLEVSGINAGLVRLTGTSGHSMEFNPLGRIHAASESVELYGVGSSSFSTLYCGPATHDCLARASTVGLIVKGTTSQTADLQQWQNNSGTTLSYVTSDGRIAFPDGPSNSSPGLFCVNQPTLGIIRATGSDLGFVYGSTQYAQIGANGVHSGNPISNVRLSCTPVVSTEIGMVVKGTASQSADLQQWQNSSGTALLQITSAGEISRQDGLNTTLKCAGNLDVYTANVHRFRFLGTSFTSMLDAAGDLGAASTRWATLYSARGQFLNDTAGSIGLIVKGAASQSVDLQQWQNSTGTVLSYVNATGLIVGAGLFSASSVDSNIIGPNAGNQLSIRKNSVSGPNVLIVPTNVNDNGVTLLAPYSTGIAAIVKGAASQSVNLQEWQDSSGTVLANVSSAGLISTTSNVSADGSVTARGGSFRSDGALSLCPRATGVVSVDLGATSGAPVFTSSATSGIGYDWTAGSGISTLFRLTCPSSSTVGLTVKAAASPSVATVLVQDSSGNSLISFGPTGYSNNGGQIAFYANGANSWRTGQTYDSGLGHILFTTNGNEQALSPIVALDRFVLSSGFPSGASSQSTSYQALQFRQNDVGFGQQEWFINSRARSDGAYQAGRLTIGAGLCVGSNIAGQNTVVVGGQGTGTGAGGNILLQVAPAGTTGSSANSLVTTVTVSSVTQNVLIAGTAAAVIPLVVKPASSQSANLQEWQDSGDNPLSTISENGYFTTRKNSAPADAELAAGEVALWFDSTNGASKLKIKGKSANGTVATGEVALT